LASHDPARIYLASRTPSKAISAINTLRQSHPTTDIVALQLDLTSFSSIKAAASKFLAQETRLDILVNNAGMMAGDPGLTEDGYELQFGTNHLGPFLLTRLLTPILLKTAAQSDTDVRIIDVSSFAHNSAPSSGIEFASLRSPDAVSSTWTRYGQSKLANALHSLALSKHYPEITSVSAHPGFIASDLWDRSKTGNFIQRAIVGLGEKLYFSSIEEGAKNQLWAATAPKLELKNGAYYVPVGKAGSESKLAKDEKLAEELWIWSEKEVAEKGY
jgi:NAD(P)-dependent dehydrogenase (short-subunit alcohol dehydrogenase family)